MQKYKYLLGLSIKRSLAVEEPGVVEPTLRGYKHFFSITPCTIKEIR